MWKGRFQSEPSSLLTLYGESISFDWRLYKHDILGSISHAKALQKKGIINDEELQAITNLSLIHISEPTRPERIGGGGVWG